MPAGPKQITQALKAAQELNACIRTAAELAAKITALLGPVDAREEKIEPRQRAKFGLDPKRPAR